MAQITIKFRGCARTLRLRAIADRDIEQARLKAERLIGRRLPRDQRTDFPTFTIYVDGVEDSGG